MTRFLVTGGAGFIGSHLTDALLARGDEVVILDDFSTGKLSNIDLKADLIRGDVADPEIVNMAIKGCSGVFHLAAVASVMKSNEEWVSTHQTNVTGTVAVLDAARINGKIPVVYASSAAVYGPQHAGKLTETMRLHPQTAYGADKLASELHASVAWGIHKIPTVGFRFMNVYGPRQDASSPYSGVISIFTDRIKNGLPVTIFGDGQQTRDFVFVMDVVNHLLSGMEFLAHCPDAHVMNVATGRGTTINELVGTVSKILDTKVEVNYAPSRPGDMEEAIGNPEYAKGLLGISAITNLSEGLKKTLMA